MPRKKHRLYFSVYYLVSGPRTWFWSDGVSVYIDWDNRDCHLDGIPVWEARTGRIALPCANFLAELAAFDRLFMTTMAERMKMAPYYWTNPRLVDVDMVTIYLEEEQKRRTTRFTQILDEAKKRTPTNWQPVLTSLAVIEKHPHFIAMQMRRCNR